MSSLADMETITLKIRSRGCHLFISACITVPAGMEEVTDLRGAYTTANESKEKYVWNPGDF